MASSDEPEKREVTLHGRKLSNIPCFRQTYLYGIGSGMVAGLTYFMLTSRPRTASHVAFGSFFTVSLSYWFYCRYTWSTASFHHRQLKHAMQQQVMTEGTERDTAAAVKESGERPEVARA
ncbi:cytochrome c oxidase assembly protein COX20, mitochondrial-like isoform X2 [Pollicipes pollicipes]|nr:cytochrome c oxidase assembly protein COX20, mitochondrial-like isoform X2 [Pollicipes pollicipes]XP_037085758.1 cytochrome c oxidase assembly protein COX20, mitochondrial-like isoform X2 [Pollicipes pollicipes]